MIYECSKEGACEHKGECCGKILCRKPDIETEECHYAEPFDDTTGLPPGYVWLKEGSPGSGRYA